MNKKLSRLLEPNMKLYFFFLLAFSLTAFAVNPAMAAVELMVTVVLYIYFRNSSKLRRQGVLQYIDSVTGSVETSASMIFAFSAFKIITFLKYFYIDIIIPPIIPAIKAIIV